MTKMRQSYNPDGKALRGRSPYGCKFRMCVGEEGLPYSAAARETEFRSCSYVHQSDPET